MQPKPHRTVSYNLLDFSDGLKNKRQNPLHMPQGALIAGENFIIEDRGLATRPGYFVAGDASSLLASGGVLLTVNCNSVTNPGAYLVDEGGRHEPQIFTYDSVLAEETWLNNGHTIVAGLTATPTPVEGTYSLRLSGNSEIPIGIRVPYNADFVWDSDAEWYVEFDIYLTSGTTHSDATVYLFYINEGVADPFYYRMKFTSGTDWQVSFEKYNADDISFVEPGGGEPPAMEYDFLEDTWYRCRLGRESDGNLHFRADTAATWSSPGTERGVSGQGDTESTPDVSATESKITFLGGTNGDDIYVDRLRFYNNSVSTASEVTALYQAKHPTEEVTWLLAQVTDGQGSAIAVLDDTLPVSAEQNFAKLLQQTTGAGVASFATLGDRTIICETGFKDEPQLFAGGLTSGATDWVPPKNVLVSPDGINYYDVSDAVKDKDDDTFEYIDDIAVFGGLLICTDAPRLSGIKIEMEQGNEGNTSGSGTAYDIGVNFNDSGDVTVENLLGSVTTWTPDLGASGHFDAAAGSKVAAGQKIYWSGGSAVIKTLTNDGTGANELILETDPGGAKTLTAIQGVECDSDGIHTTNFVATTDTDDFDETLSSGGRYVYADGSYRIAIPGANNAITGKQVRITYKVVGGGAYASRRGGVKVDNVGIAIQSSAATATAVPTEMTFNDGESGFTIATESGEITSDWVDFTYDDSNTFLHVLDIASQANQPSGVGSR